VACVPRLNTVAGLCSHVLTFVGTTAFATAADGFHKLTQTQIRARLAGKEITDGVHWAEQYMRDGTFKAFHMGKATAGRWSAHNGELCLELTTAERDARKFGCRAQTLSFG
jgi:hypothetical protein